MEKNLKINHGIFQDCFSLHAEPQCTDMWPKLHSIQPHYLTYSISYKLGSVLSFCLCLWTLFDYQRMSLLGESSWQLVFVFRIQYVCLIQPLIVCGVLFNGPKGMTSVQIAHFIQHRMMMQTDLQTDLQLTLAQQHTNTHVQTHAIPINLSDNLYWALLERKKGRENQ